MSVTAISGLRPTEESLYDKPRPDELGKDDFMLLLTKQLEFQDPLDPQDPAEFTSQLTQFSSLEQMVNLNGTLEAMQALQSTSNNTNATNLIGREVLFGGNATRVTDGVAQDVSFYSDIPLQGVKVQILDRFGNIVETINAGNVGSGTQSFGWSPTDATGNPLPDGVYSFQVEAYDASGNFVEVAPLSRGEATGVHFDSGQTLVEVNGRNVDLSDIYSVFQRPEPIQIVTQQPETEEPDSTT